MTKTTIALAAVLFAATSSAAFANYYDPNLANRYPGYAAPDAYGYTAAGKLGAVEGPAAAIQSAPVSLRNNGKVFQSAPVGLRQSAPALQQRDVSLPGARETNYDGVNQFNADRFDRASSPFAGGGGL